MFLHIYQHHHWGYKEEKSCCSLVSEGWVASRERVKQSLLLGHEQKSEY